MNVGHPAPDQKKESKLQTRQAWLARDRQVLDSTSLDRGRKRDLLPLKQTEQRL